MNDIKKATLKDALEHPNWDMGDKITIDSASMFNKSLELIEAMHLFNVSFQEIKVVIHLNLLYTQWLILKMVLPLLSLLCQI